MRARILATLLALAVCCGGAGAQDLAQHWPQRTVTIVVPFSAGSTPDSIARVVAERLAARLGQPVLVENRPGASGNTGTAAVAKAAPDGYTLGVSIVGPLVINAILFPKMPYDTAKEIAPVTILASQPSVLVAYTGVAAGSVPELLALLKKDAGKFTYGSIGRGSLSHLAMESLASKAGVKLVHLPFQGSPAAATALLRGDVQLAVLPAASVVPLGRDGKLKLLAVFLFAVPIEGSVLLLASLSTLFIATNLSIGYTFSTIAQNQLQAVQMSFMFFLPNILLSGFMFPFAGMPGWAQTVGEFLPLTHYIRIVRGIMLKGATLYDLQFEALALVGLMLIAMTFAVRRFRTTLD
jgi:tripartite-type tricarboxylate transporter receptor subunit TctC